jgi:hypothetical protein
VCICVYLWVSLRPDSCCLCCPCISTTQKLLSLRAAVPASVCEHQRPCRAPAVRLCISVSMSMSCCRQLHAFALCHGRPFLSPMIRALIEANNLPKRSQQDPRTATTTTRESDTTGHAKLGRISWSPSAWAPHLQATWSHRSEKAKGESDDNHSTRKELMIFRICCKKKQISYSLCP